MLSQESIDELKLLGKKNKKLQDCYDELIKFLESPYMESYNTVHELIGFVNSQIKDAVDGKLSVRVGEDGVEESSDMPLDIFSSKDNKGFDRVLKYVTELSKILLALDVIRGKVSPQAMEASKKGTSDIDEARMRLKDKRD